MTKTPPNRRGITFEVGAQLEARDSLKNWYAASIEKIDYEDERVLIHYRQWSHRYDEWFDWSSPYLRPVERIQLRREGLQENAPVPGFHVNDKVLASWSDCRFYPAKVLAVNKDASYTVKFFDGVIQTVKGIHVKPFYKERNGGRSKTQDRSRERHPVTREQNGKDRKPLENGRGIQENGRGQRDKRGTSCHDTESDTEEEMDEEQRERKGDELKKNKNASTDEMHPERRKKMAEEEEGKEKMSEKTKNQELEREGTMSNKELAKEESEVEADVRGECGQRRARERCGPTGKVPLAERHDINGVKEIKEESVPSGAEAQLGGETHGSSKLSDGDMEEEQGSSEATPRNGPVDDGGTPKEGPSQTRRTRGRLAEGGRAENLRDVIELRKRKICLGQTTPPKRSKADTSAERSTSTECTTATNPSSQTQTGSDSDPTTLTVATNGKEVQGVAATTDIPKSAVDEAQISPALQAVLRRQAHLPTTNKYSREPLYRVIKNQPPPILSIELDHNPFKCKAPGCLKSFRKAKLLHYHMKYYHETDKTSENDLSPTRNIQTRASEKQAALESPKRRRTISASMHSSLNSTRKALNSTRGDGKATRLNEKRRTSAPPAVSAGEQQRPSLREKSKENQLEKTSRKPLDKERERIVAETVAKEREKLKEKKHRDFLRIKLKKKKKKKKKSKSGLCCASKSSVPLLYSCLHLHSLVG
ncbi:hypothetical protein AGOR_G00137120 [Albula goreensis]|uniref:C2H2-type domain-containing protein n=1 Tax=Albula goreensis TaxID=1534307 RepID=A0A8T3DB02_9TELE|nr:hypothetical protein AGOR_G00137120 [Albula goreensis]